MGEHHVHEQLPADLWVKISPPVGGEDKGEGGRKKLLATIIVIKENFLRGKLGTCKP
jgi:hypothetical protein